MRTCSSLAAVLALLACGCIGNGAVFVTIEAVGPDGVLRIPEDVDRVSVAVSDANDTVELLQKDYPLARETHKFPLTLALEPGRQTRSPVQLEVVGWRADAEVARAQAKVPVVPSEVSNVTVRLETK